MIPARAVLALGVAAGLSMPHAAFALSLPQAVALAQRGNPVLAQSKAVTDAADAHLA